MTENPRGPREETSSAAASQAAASQAAASQAETSPAALAPADLAIRIGAVSLDDAYRLRKRLTKVRRLQGATRRRELAALEQRVDRAEKRIEARRSAVPTISYPSDLPVSGRVDELAAAIRDNQVVVVAGETGSGKSTQLPKICLSIGRGINGLIGHTQPRRIAARTLAERIAEETETIVGGAIGYAIRFGDHTGPRTLVKLMTDGILLAEIVSDPDLLRYDTIILDEAHERSLNIDFLLGYLARLLPRRPDLRLIITSATIDPEKFSQHFSGAPIVEVSGRTYPVEIRYRPYGSDDSDDDSEDDPDDADNDFGGFEEPIDQTTAIVRAVDELTTAGDGDILVFLSGERDITDTADALKAHLKGRGGLAGSIEVLPLYGRLSMADQHRVFAPSGRRRIVLATNVAETSLTVPGVRYVIDPGTARISRYSSRTKVQRLPIEKVSQASAGQRAGRCGRVADGICIRLYSEEDFAARPEFTDPEIMRTSLASVILKMASLGLGEIESFPFLDPPDAKQITDGITVLMELGALDRASGPGSGRAAVRLTGIGRKLAQLPVDPRLARILVEADQRRCLSEALVIVSALAIRDVREYPLEERDKAVAYHSRFVDPTSDFVGFVSLWHYLKRQMKTLSGNKFRKMCKVEYLHYLRIREWQDLHAQLMSAAGSLGMAIDDSVVYEISATEPTGSAATGRAAKNAGTKGAAATAVSVQGGPQRGSAAIGIDHEALHIALAAGLLSHIGSRIERESKSGSPIAARNERKRKSLREYQGTRGTTFAIWPGSVLAKTGAPFVLAAELVETSRLWARTAAAIKPEWIEQVGGDLLRRNYSEPRWSGKRQAVMATEKVMLLGVTLIAARTVSYDKIDPELSRELLIRHGLVAGEMTLPLPFLDANVAALDEVAESERRARRRDIVKDDDALYALYDRYIPADVTSGQRLEAWWRKASRTDSTVLRFTPEMLVAAGSELARRDEYPDQLDAGTARLDLAYVFEPGMATDGITATVPLAALASIDPSSVPAQVPGLRRELALALIKSLPKGLRRAFVPAPDFADVALVRIGNTSGALPDRLAEELTSMTGIGVTPADFDYSKVPDHLRMRFTVVDALGRAVASGDDLAVMQRELAPDTRRALAMVSSTVERTGLTAFPAEGLAQHTTGTASGAQVTAYPALVDAGDSVSIRVFADPADQERAMRAGTRRLVALVLRSQITGLAGRMRQLAAPRGPSAPGAKSTLTPNDLLRLATAPHGSLPALILDAADAAIDALLDWAGGPAWDGGAFDVLAARISGQLERAVADILAATTAVLTAGSAADAAIAGLVAGGDSTGLALAPTLKKERDRWLTPGFITAVRAGHLPDVARYLMALATRAERARERPDRDRERAAEIADLQRLLADREEELRPERRGDDDVTAAHRLLAEYRIALFAQPMKTAVPVSVKRIRAAIAALAD
ncbi:MAG: ATP-dependent RNA helicase HrpA [Nakamurella sp.]